MPARPLIVALRLLLAGVLLVSCSTGRDGRSESTATSTPRPSGSVPVRLQPAPDDLDGLLFELSEVPRPAPDGTRAPLATARPLPADRVQALLDRTEPLPAADRTDFALRSGSPPPPRPGQEVQQPWPPPPRADVAPGVPADGLRVTRFAPEGPVSLAPHVSLTFSQPMIAVTSQDQASKTVPATLDPTPPGSWRWLGTRTLLFDPDPRLPMATNYTVRVPAGTTSALGAPLDQPVTFTFQTPPVQVTRFAPQGRGQSTTPLLSLTLDQRVDPAQLMPFVELEGGRTAPQLELVDPDTLTDLERPSAEPGRLLVLRPATRLEPATEYVLRLREGAPSAEGPRVTERSQSATFSTFDPLQVEDQGCWERGSGCSPDGQLWIRMNNALDEDTAPEHVTVAPDFPGKTVDVARDWIRVRGSLPPRSTVEVTLGAELADTWGQTLGNADTRSFRIGPADPVLMGPGKEQIVLDPAGPAILPFYTRNLSSFELTVWRPTPAQIGPLAEWLRENRWRDRTGAPPVPPVHQGRHTVDAEPDTLTETVVDLAPHLQGDTGQLMVMAEANLGRRGGRERVVAWVQRTRLGLTAQSDGRTVQAWVTDLQTGAPVQGAEVRLVGAGQGVAISDASGLARLAPYASRPDTAALVATHQGDLAVLSRGGSLYLSGGWQARSPKTDLRWLVFDDRGMYKPGEQARFKGIVRPFTPVPGQGLAPFEGPGTVAWTLQDSQGADIASGTTGLSKTGSFDVTVEDLGESPNLGTARLRLTASWGGRSDKHVHTFQIQEFRRPEFEVGTSVDPRPYVLGQHALATVEAAYYSGGGLPAAPVRWRVVAKPGSWRPTGWQGFTFGTWRPWWRSFSTPSRGGRTETVEGMTGADGTHTVRMDFLALSPTQPTSVQAEATVVDVNRQRWTSSSTLLVHPADRYVGLKLDRSFVEKGEPLTVQAIVVDLDGAAVSGTAVTVDFERLTWKRVDGSWEQVPVRGTDCTLTSADEPVSCKVRPDEGGTWRLTARIEDAEGRANSSTRTVWVSGGGSTRPQRGVDRQEIVLVPDRAEPGVGDTVEILVQAPFWPAEGLLTTRQHGLMHTERVTLDGPSTTVRLPITEEHIPNVHVAVDLVGQTPRTDADGEPVPGAPERVAYAHGDLNLKVPPRSRTLSVDVTPAAAEVRPGASTHVDVQVSGPEGEPVSGAEVAVWMVDEAVLALSGYQTPDPLSLFYSERPDGTRSAYLRGRVLLVDPETLRDQLGQVAPPEEEEGGRPGLRLGGGSATGARGVRMDKARSTGGVPPPAPAPMREASAAAEAPGGARTDSSPIAVRTDFRALAVFAPARTTDTDGRVRVEVDLPDSLTRYRVMAVAADPGVRFGSGESTVTARQPLMLRPSPPRFLNVGDKAELPLVVQNPTDAPATVDLALAIDNGRLLDDLDQDVLSAPERTTGGLTFVVPAEDRREVRLPVGVLDAGTFRFQAVIASNDATDAATDELPVWTPATTEAFATYGSLTEGGLVQPVQAPQDAWPQYGGLQITTSSTQLQALTDALIYLNDYPFACTEQVSSRVLANAALRDVLDAFEAEQLPSAEALADTVRADLELLARRQRRSGGFSYWGRTDDVYPLPSLHAVHALVRARDNGWEPDPEVLRKGLRYARDIERHIPGWYSPRARLTLRAYALYVRHRAGEEDRTQALALYGEGLDALPLEAQGWLLPTLHATGQTGPVQAVLRNWDNAAVETASSATFAASYTDANDYVLLHGARRTDAVLLDALLEVQPRHDLNEKIVRGLLGHRRKGRWSSTQENGFVLLALHRYFHVYEGVTPDFVARAWLDDGFAGEQAFRGRTTARSHLDVPMTWLQDGPPKRDLTLAIEGEGRLYYRIGLRYAPRDLDLPPADHGFTVTRTYAPVDAPDDVRRDSDGTWRVKAGARVRVRLSMVAESRRTMVALVDPLPGGFEPLNPSLAVTGSAPADPGATRSTPYWWWSRPWYNHQNLRDERAEAFADLLWPGVHEYTYVATATTPGRFVVPPARAEEMYHPETFGRSGGDRVVIE